MNAADGSQRRQGGSGPSGTLESRGGGADGEAPDGAADGGTPTAPGGAIDSHQAGRATASASPDRAGKLSWIARSGRTWAGRAWPGASRPVVRHLALLAVYLVAGVAATWPIATYLTGRLPQTRDVSNYVWGLQWTAHQVIHLGNPYFTAQMAAPAGIRLAFGTTMPLAGLIMTPVTLAFGPAVAFIVLVILTPGLACYFMYRAARLWLGEPGAIAAGALFGLSSMLDWQVWYHLNVALGTLFLPMTLEAAVRLRRRPGRRQAVILGLVLGTSALINQESTVLATILAAAILLPWLLGRGATAVKGRAAAATDTATAPAPVTALSSGQGAGAGLDAAPGLDAGAGQDAAPTLDAAQEPATAAAGSSSRLTPRARLAITGLSALVAVVVASPQLIAMAQQALAGGASIQPARLIYTYSLYGAGLPTLFAPSPRLGSFGLHNLAAAYTYDQPAEGVATFGVLLSALALAGLAASWQRRSARWFAVLWACCAVVALGPTLILGTKTNIPLTENWHGTKVSWLMPFTWLMHLPGLSALREADRFALLGIIGAAILAGAAVDWLARHAKPLIVVAAVLAVFEAGWPGTAGVGTMSATLPPLDGPIAADHSHSIVVDVPYGLRGGIPLFGSSIIPQEQLLATEDNHPRAISYTAWVPAPTAVAIAKHPFYVRLAAAQVGSMSTPAQLRSALRDARKMHIGWALVWRDSPGMRQLHSTIHFRVAIRFLTALGFRFDYQADGALVYRPDW